MTLFSQAPNPSVRWTTVSQCEPNVLSTQINLYCLMTNQMAALLEQRSDVGDTPSIFLAPPPDL